MALSIPEMNILRERYKFYRRKQKFNESHENFAHDIQKLSESCQFGDFKDYLIRDHFIFGLHDERICLAIVDNGGDPSINELIEFCQFMETQNEAIGQTMGNYSSHTNDGEFGCFIDSSQTKYLF